MNTILVMFTIFAFAFAAPLERQKNFHDQIVDFVELIAHEVGSDVGYEYIPMVHYMEYEEFQAALVFINSEEFEDILRDVRNLPEYQAFVDYLHNENVKFSKFFGIGDHFRSRPARQVKSAKDLTSYIKEFIKILPNDDIIALYNQKIAEYDDFRAAMKTIQSDEFKDLLRNLWSNKATQNHLRTLAKYGLDLKEVSKYIMEYYEVN